MRAKTAGILLFLWGVLVAALQIATMFLAIIAGHIERIAVTDVVCLGVAIVMGWSDLLAYRAGTKQHQEPGEEPADSPPSAPGE